MSLNENANANDSDVSRIREALRRYAGLEKTGSQLKSLIEAVCPDFNLREATGILVGPGALTKFLATEVADLVQPIGKRGGDPIYLIHESPASTDDSDGRVEKNPDLWSIFSSPSLRQQLIYSPSEKRMHSKFIDSPTPDGYLAIKPLEKEDFREISRKFLEIAPKEISNLLEEVLERENYYTEWTSILRSQFPLYYQRWGIFRVGTIKELFRENMRASGLPEAEIQQFVSRMEAEQVRAFRERVSRMVQTTQAERPIEMGAAKVPARPSRAALSEQPVHDLRSVARAAIEHMAIEDVRRIAIPLGVLIDAGLLRQP
ncbi:hypothetical protein ROS9278_00477 [Roseomonas sp. CECT 9278]|nr:hypothetical protein ROS9278_00477 [Roseomonas sp. CECT 9278]